LERNIGDFATIVPAAMTYERDVALLNAVYPGCVSTGGSMVVARGKAEGQGQKAEGQGEAAWTNDAIPTGMAPRAYRSHHAPRDVGSSPTEEVSSSPSPYWFDARPLATVTIEQLMADHQLDHIDVLKLDCEGSEFSILENTTSLDSIGAVIGEYHGRERFLELVARKFKGWRLRILRDEDPGTFWLINPAPVGNGLRAVPPTVGVAPPLLHKQDGLGKPSSQSGLRIDIERGLAIDTARFSSSPYDDAYYVKYLSYEGDAMSNRLGRLRTALVKKHCRIVLDVGIGCGTFLKQWAVAGCCCGSSHSGTNKKPCGGCGRGKAANGKLPTVAVSTSNGYGYDVNPRAVDWLAQRELFIDPYKHIPSAIEGLTFWDSLEHLPDPADLLARMRVGMFAFVSLPVFDDLTRVTESKHYRPGEHVSYFTHDGLVRFMAEQGFDLLESNRAESLAGREAIESFTFHKTRGPRLNSEWHRQALGDPLDDIEPGKPLVLRTANGIGDLCWLMVLAGSLKRRLNLPKLSLELQLAGDDRDDRALEFVRRFTAIDEVTSSRFDIHLQPVAADARLRYIPNGYAPSRSAGEAPYTLIINPWLEWQGRLENFLPELEPQWNVLSTGYRRDPSDVAEAAGYSRSGQLMDQPRTGHICIHLCSRRDNTIAGMNRDGLWSLDDWLAVITRLRTVSDLPIYILGAKEDAEYAGELMNRAGGRIAQLYDACGATSATLAIEVLRQSSLMVSFASGLAVAACYLGVPTVAFWNREGHSISPNEDIWFSDSFSTNWASPQMLAAGLYYPALYGRDDPDTIFAAILKMLSRGRSLPLEA
jgi:hypothetical protein